MSEINKNLFNKQVYIVTGASRGFGLAITKKLVAAGARVGMLARNDVALQESVTSLATEAVFGVACDIANKAQVVDAFARVKAHFGQLNGLINNAGLARPANIVNIDESELLLQVNTNFVGTVLCCQAAIPLLRGEDNPRIVNISSASAWHYDEMTHLSIYASTKAAVERFTRDLRTELQEDAIAVTCVRPGSAWTDFSAGWDEQRLKDGMKAWHQTGPAMDVGMEIEHVADAVVHCLGYPAGVAIDLLEVRPNQSVPKLAW